MSDETAGTDRQIGGETREEHKVSGDKVISKIKELIHQGNVRRIIIKNEDGRSLIEMPLSVLPGCGGRHAGSHVGRHRRGRGPRGELLDRGGKGAELRGLPGVAPSYERV